MRQGGREVLLPQARRRGRSAQVRVGGRKNRGGKAPAPAANAHEKAPRIQKSRMRGAFSNHARFAFAMTFLLAAAISCAVSLSARIR